MWKSGLDYKGGKWFARISEGIYVRPEVRGKMLEKAADQRWKKEQEQAKERKAWEDAHQSEISRFQNGNPQQQELLKQTDQYFKDHREKIPSAGCVFRCVQVPCEIASGMTLSGGQIVAVWDDAISKGFLSSSGSVQDYSGIANLTLTNLGITAYGFEFGTNTNNGRLVGYIGTMPYNDEDTHKAFYLSKNDDLLPFFNPGMTNNNVYSGGWNPVFMYPKKK